MDEIEPGRAGRIRKALGDLNEWESLYGNTYGAAAGLGSTGEAPARIASLKHELRALGAVFQWDGTAYALIETVTEGAGDQLPDGAATKPPD